MVCVCDGARACLAMYLQHETAVTCAFGAKRRAHGALALGAGVCDRLARGDQSHHFEQAFFSIRVE